jgi:hypothetical protein
VSDERLEVLLRDARATGTGEAWRDAGRALAQAGRTGEAGDALLRAAATGTPVAEVAESVEAPLDAFRLRTVAPGGAFAWFEAPVWSQDGETLFFVESGRVLAYDRDSGETRVVFDRMPFRASVIAPNPSGSHLVAHLFWDGGGISSPGGLAAIEVESGELSAWVHWEGDESSSFQLGPATPWLLAWPSDESAVLIRRGGDVQRVALDVGAALPSPLTEVSPAPEVVLAGGLTALDRSGFLAGASYETQRVSFYGSRGDEHGSAPFPCEGQSHVLTASERALVVTDDAIHLLAPGGGACKTTRPPDCATFCPSPSGRLVGAIQAGGESGETASFAVLVDVREDRSRNFELPLPPPTAMAWSPSGRCLALTSPGRLILLEGA